ncbi:MAG: BrnT family toxin [Armatimonadota bacterium]|nr:BrnT family toxin [Armatimonadota bacterium]
MHFEWDEDKNESNIEKHNIDFEDAWEVFEGPLLVALDTRQDYGEDRWIGIGFLGQRAVVVAYTYRGPDTARIISMRKALHHERLQFEEFLRNRLGED